MKKILLITAAAVLLSTASVAQATDGNKSWHRSRGVTLRGSNEVPAVTTNTYGRLWYKWKSDQTRLKFMLNVFRGQDVTMAHLHCAVAGQNGPAVVTLFGDVQGGYDINGVLIRSAIENDNIMAAGASCPTPVTDLASLKTAIAAGQIYVNVHTMANPGGEIRAQLK